MDDTWWKGLGDLDDKQKLVMSLPLEGRYLIRGCPGSGKTNLLLLRANYAALAGVGAVAVVVFNHTLQTFLIQGGDHYEFASDYILTSTQIFLRLLKQEGVEISLPQKFEESRKVLSDAVLKLVPQFSTPPYHSLFLDEAQDYTRDELEIFLAISENLFIAADSRQRIYGGKNLIDDLQSKATQTITLEHHYRNGREICRLADAVGKHFTEGYEPVFESCNYDESSNKSKVDVVCTGLDQQVAQLVDRLGSQIKAYPNVLLGVLAPTRKGVHEIAAKLNAAGLDQDLNVQLRDDDGYQDFVKGRQIWLSTIHSSKGLEFRAVHLMDCESLAKMGGNQKRIAYTGITRAKTSLTLYHQKPLPSYVAGALAEVVPKGKKVDLESVFGKK
jgi:superfamily I DNA/RNA helicase